MSGEYLTTAELRALGFEHVGREPQVSSKCSFHNVKGSIGDHSRIDDFCIFKGEVHIGSFVHVSSFGLFSGVAAPITIGNFTAFAARCTVLSASDDYGAIEALPASCLPDDVRATYSAMVKGPVRVGIGALFGVGTLILPNVVIGDGVVAGAYCIIHHDVPAGIMLRSFPTRTIARQRNVEMTKKFALHILENMDGEV